MPILLRRTGSLGGPWPKVSMASRYILRAIMISPRFSGESGVAGGAATAAVAGVLVPSSMPLTGCAKVRAAHRLAANPVETARKNILASCPYLSTRIIEIHGSLKHTNQALEQSLLLFVIRFLLRPICGRRLRRGLPRRSPRRRIGGNLAIALPSRNGRRAACRRGRARRAGLP